MSSNIGTGIIANALEYRYSMIKCIEYRYSMIKSIEYRYSKDDWQ